MADAYAQRAPSDEAVPSGRQQEAVDAAEPSAGVSEMEAVEAQAGQMFRYVSPFWCPSCN